MVISYYGYNGLSIAAKKGVRALLLNPCYIPRTEHLIIDNILLQLVAFSLRPDLLLSRAKPG